MTSVLRAAARVVTAGAALLRNQSHYKLMEPLTSACCAEATVKIIGLRHHYFTAAWNLFDFVLVIASIVGILMEDLMTDFPVSPTLLRVVRVFRIGRILRLIKVKTALFCMIKVIKILKSV